MKGNRRLPCYHHTSGILHKSEETWFILWKPRERTMVDSLSAPAAREERIYNTTVKDKFL
ncbi:hypothetical protein YC2023_043321 [Brassica napus]